MTAAVAPKGSPEAYAAMMADPEYRGRLEAVMASLIVDFEWFMEYGSDTQRFQLIRVSLPDMLRARRAEEENSRDQLIRDAFMRIRSALAEHIKVNVPVLSEESAA